jgi:hypothetical protein
MGIHSGYPVQCEIPLAFEASSVPAGFTLDIGSGVVGGMQSVRCTGTLEFRSEEMRRDLPSLMTDWDIVFANRHNIHNTMKVTVSGELQTTVPFPVHVPHQPCLPCFWVWTQHT